MEIPYTMKNKCWILSKQFKGNPTVDNFKMTEEELPDLVDGDILCEAEIISIDPYARIITPVGHTVYGRQVACVIESKSSNYPVGSHVILKRTCGWRTHTVTNEKLVKPYPTVLHGKPKATVLSICGEPGMTAYFGIFDILKPKTGETIVVNTAAGAVGCLVAQIAKLLGCKVIAFTGSDRKVQWLRNNTRADHVFNYKKVNIQQAISEAAPEGVDCFFDNVAGEFASKVYSRMKTFGRIACCGFISHYNKDFRNLELATMVQGYMIASQLKCEGFQVDRYEGRFDEARKQVVEWMDKGLLINAEHKTNGFQNLPQALIDMYNGENIGKTLAFITPPNH